MPKMKTHKGAKRRFKMTATGKILQMKQGRGVKRNRAKRVRRLYSKMLPSSPTNAGHLEKALPYGLR
ncbi:MAG: 50S ribosomal protein L35 [Chloroflexaceae bacterium]|nr:50S ribosomal protein L35 [Chloroflexaceae bacterium]NJO06132.1 50S ribosomal protein L35 [Chloroflexaceae bacterium]